MCGADGYGCRIHAPRVEHAAQELAVSGNSDETWHVISCPWLFSGEGAAVHVEFPVMVFRMQSFGEVIHMLVPFVNGGANLQMGVQNAVGEPFLEITGSEPERRFEPALRRHCGYGHHVCAFSHLRVLSGQCFLRSSNWIVCSDERTIARSAGFSAR